MDEPLPVIELHLASIATCDECGNDFTLRISKTHDGAVVVPITAVCPHCGQKSEVDSREFCRMMTGRN